ncbi:MAG: hypothetical protein ACREA0_27190, partial [bacterium]
MSRLHQELGLTYRNPPLRDVLAPAWSNRGQGSRWTKDSMLAELPRLKKLGIRWIHMGDPWQDNLGDYGFNPEKFRDAAELKGFIRRLNDEGFHVTAFYCDLLVDVRSRIARDHPEYFIRDERGELRRCAHFGQIHYILCPAYAPARDFERQAALKLAREWGFEGVKNDGRAMALPCFSRDHAHAYPEQAVEDYPLLQQAVYKAFQEVHPNTFVVAFCYDGVVPYFYHHPFTTRPWPNADQLSVKQARWKQKLFKAIFGPTRVLLDDHSDAKYLSGVRGNWYQGPVSGLAMGSVLETVSDSSYDMTGRHYPEIFKAYHLERLPDGGEYDNLYSVIHDVPEAHVVRKGNQLYYGFFAEAHAGPVELRGLRDGVTYDVRD